MARIDPAAVAQVRAGEAYVSPVRIAITADGALVTDDDPAAVAILVGAGGSLPWSVAEAYGLVVADAPASDGTDGEGRAGDGGKPARTGRRRASGDGA